MFEVIWIAMKIIGLIIGVLLVLGLLLVFVGLPLLYMDQQQEQQR